MPITLGTNTISGLSVGGLPAGSVTNSNIASGTIAGDRLATNAKIYYNVAHRNSNASYGGDSGWNDFMSLTFSSTYGGHFLVFITMSAQYESGPVQAFGRFLLNGSKIGVNFNIGRQTNNNSSMPGQGLWSGNVGAGTHTIMFQVRNLAGTWQTNIWGRDETAAHNLVVGYYP